MNALPVIQRELRAEARHTVNYWLRLLGASATLAIFVVMTLDQAGGAPQSGPEVFGNLNTALFAAIWVLVPLLTADCISRERREGTLGLLLLTPLTSLGVVIGKSLIHALRAATLMLAALPVLALPFLLGGVTWREAVMALLLDSGSVCLALAAGLVASSLCTRWNRALILAELLAAVFLSGLVSLFVFALFLQVGPYIPGFSWSEVDGEQLIMGATICTGVGGAWSEGLNSLSAAAVAAWFSTVVEIFLVAALVSGVAILWAARRLEHCRREEPLTARQLWWQQFFLGPRFWKSVFRRNMARMLETNPIGWLQQRSTTSRVIKWGWVMAVMTVESMVLADSGWTGWTNLAVVQGWLLLLLGLSLAFSAAGSFQRERQNGALELILVTPLSVGQIIWGRLCGLWGQFLPALAVMGTIWMFLCSQGGMFDFWPHYYGLDVYLNYAFFTFLLASFAAIPVVGLYFSLQRRHFLAAWLLTLALCLALPWGVIVTAGWYSNFLNQNNAGAEWRLGETLAWASFFQVLWALRAGWLLYQNLRRREFAQ